MTSKTFYYYFKNPKIITIYFRLIITELCGANLKEIVSGSYTCPHIPEKKEILHQITAALDYLHSKNICHRDIKPTNIFISLPDLTVRPRVKLGNLAITRLGKTALW